VATNTLTPYQMVDKLMAMEPLGGRKATELLTAMQKLRPPTDDQLFAWPSCNAYRVRCGSCWPKTTTPT
jgi:hypothetical protein